MRRGTIAILGVLLGAAAGILMQRPATRRVEGPGWSLELAAAVRTGHQRAERLAFTPDGTRLAVLCPRYNRLVIYRVEPDPRLSPIADLPLAGRPVAVAALADRLLVVQRPAGDARHLEPAWWDAFDQNGRPRGGRFRLGTDPDDLALTPDGRTALVLLSGRAEGEARRPPPTLLVVDLADPDQPRPRAETTLETAPADPERLVLSPEGRELLITLRDPNAALRIDLADLDHPRLIGTGPAPAPQGRSIRLTPNTNAPDDWSARLDPPRAELLLEHRANPVGRLPLPNRPTDLDAYQLGPHDAWIAVCDRAGSVRLVRCRWPADDRLSPTPPPAACCLTCPNLIQ